MKRFLLLLFTFFLLFSARAQQTVEPSPIKWYDIETAMKLFHQKPKPIMIDVYTDWCGWCKYMMKTTFANQNLANYINTYFYPVRLNAETKDTIRFEGKTYVSHGKTHDLALWLLDRQTAYPTLVFFDMRLKKYRVPGYLKIKDLEPILVFLQEDAARNVSLDEFRLAYALAHPQIYKDDLAKISANDIPDTSGTVNWLSFQQAWEKNKQQPRKFLVYSYVSWCYSCKPMEKVVFQNPQVAKYINDNFYPVRFDAASTDTIILGGKRYTSMGKGQPHQLAMWLFNRQFAFPAIIFLDDKFNNIGRAYGFYLPQQVMPMLQYFATDEYKKQSFQEYMKHKQQE